MDTQTNESNKTNKLFPSVLTAFGAATLSLLVGTIFVFVALFSVVIGIRRGLQTYSRLSEKP